MVLDTSLLNIQQYKVGIKGKVDQSWERSSALLYTSVQQLFKREPSGCPRLQSPTLYIYMYIYMEHILFFLPVDWSCRIYWLHIFGRVRPHLQRMSWYDTKQSDHEVPVMLELWGMQSTPSLLSLPGSLCPGMVAPNWILSMAQIELNCVFMLNWITRNRTASTTKLCTYAKLNCLKLNCFWYWNYTHAKLNLTVCG